MLRCLPALIARAPARDVLTDSGSRADVRVAANRDGRDELRVAADERAVVDGRDLLPGAVVVARDRPGADVDLFADDCVTEIREVSGFGPGTEFGFLDFDEIANRDAIAELDVLSEMSEWSHMGSSCRRCSERSRYGRE